MKVNMIKWRYVLESVALIAGAILWFGFLAFLCYAQSRGF